MIITCSSCLKRYLIDPVLLGSTGRTVRCSSCGHIWHQPPPDDMPRVLDEPPHQSLSSPSTSDKDHLSLLASQTTSGMAQNFERSLYEPLTAGVPGARAQKSFSKVSLGFILGFICLGLASFLYFGRFYVVKYSPSLISFYDSLGIKTNSLAQHLELKNVSWVPGVDSEQNPVFILKGYIFNASHKALAIPPLSVVFVSDTPEAGMEEKKCVKGACIIDRWIAHTSSDRILPGEIYPFQITLNKKIPSKANNLYVEFVRP